MSWTVSEIDEETAFQVLRSTGGRISRSVPPSRSCVTGSHSLLLMGRSSRGRRIATVDVVDESGRRTLFETEAISTPAMPLTLHQNHPNPFNPSTTIGYYLPVDAPVTLEVYDSTGRLVARLLDGAKQERGTHSVAWRGLDSSGRSVSSGVYFYRLTSGKETISKKMVLLR